MTKILCDLCEEETQRLDAVIVLLPPVLDGKLRFEIPIERLLCLRCALPILKLLGKEEHIITQEAA